MEMFRKKIENSEAVSPVVGVMLMLVVTIIIAAVVSGFAGGITGNTKTAPQAAIDVSIESNADLGMGMSGTQMLFTLLSGDSIPTKDISIITYYTNKNGHVYKHEQTATSDSTYLYGDSWGPDYTSYNATVPYLNDLTAGYAGKNLDVNFGSFTWMTGDVLATGGDPGTSDLLGINNTANPHGIADSDFGTGSVVDVKILHIPSGKYIFDKEVVVK